jgi:hypothetical protein
MSNPAQKICYISKRKDFTFSFRKKPEEFIHTPPQLIKIQKINIFQSFLPVCGFDINPH